MMKLTTKHLSKFAIKRLPKFENPWSIVISRKQPRLSEAELDEAFFFSLEPIGSTLGGPSHYPANEPGPSHTGRPRYINPANAGAYHLRKTKIVRRKEKQNVKCSSYAEFLANQDSLAKP